MFIIVIVRSIEQNTIVTLYISLLRINKFRLLKMGKKFY